MTDPKDMWITLVVLIITVGVVLGSYIRHRWPSPSTDRFIPVPDSDAPPEVWEAYYEALGRQCNQEKQCTRALGHDGPCNGGSCKEKHEKDDCVN